MLNSTLLLIKPNATAKNHIGAILKLLEEAGFIVDELRMLKMTRFLAEAFYSVHKDKYFFEDLIEFMMSAKTVACIVRKDDSIQELRELIGATDPADAHDGTIRKLFGETLRRNAVHASDSLESAKREIGILFPDYNP
ncbi:MAG: nucleoside-diphosphate kinase [Candidatus Cloacimonetes bacterium]|nr:nucleoside-diphosphate kinase [Candidatus Cloacimonadota bacterium]